jgi:DNA-directed RNA polymerase subunit RPC12/RpoP
MKEKIEGIRQLLSQLENDASQVESAAEFRALSGLELPDIIADVVDLLMPELTPYAFAFYIYLLRHSIVGSGNPYVRAGRKSLQRGIMKSNSGQGDDLSYQTVQRSFEALEAIGAIRREGEATREGTLYRILLPEEIDLCQRRRAEQAERPVIVATESEADFYNVRENRLKIYERDNYKCTYCGKQLTRFTATLDHITPVSKGGDNSAENLKTACLKCNSRKTARPLGDFLADSFPTSL